MTDDRPMDTLPPTGGGDVIREQDKIMLVLAYLNILALIPLLTVKDSDYVKWHAKQGLVLSAAQLVLLIIGLIPVIGWLVMCLSILAYPALAIIAIIKALQPNRWRIPLIADIADKF